MTLRLLGTNSKVALLAEGVDRNDTNILAGTLRLVALLAEGVDRNTRPSRMFGKF